MHEFLVRYPQPFPDAKLHTDIELLGHIEPFWHTLPDSDFIAIQHSDDLCESISNAVADGVSDSKHVPCAF